MLAEFMPLSDMQIGELIELDGQTRLALGMHVDLERYLSSIPALQSHPVALDAAIEYTLRSAALQHRFASHERHQRQGLSGHVACSDAIASAAQALAVRYPHLLKPIQVAAFMTQELVSTTRLAATTLPTARRLPCTIGLALNDGRGRYELREVLGKGGQGTVYLAVDRKLSEPDKPAWAAVKVLPTSARPGDVRSHTQRSANLAEATKARRITHQCVVRVLDAWDEPTGDGAPETVIVYEHVPGGTLESLVNGRSERMPAREAALLIARIANAVQAAHASGVVHCDLKPANVLIRADGTPAVADFGVARRVTEGEGGGEKAIGNGNLAYASPEQVRLDEGWATPASDIFSLGGLLYWLLTGALPCGTTADEVKSAAWSNDPLACERALAAPAQHGLDPDLAAICGRALRRAHTDRYGSADALAEDLHRWLAYRPLRWTKSSVTKRAQLVWKRAPWLVLASCAAGLFFISGTLGVGYLINSRRMDEIEQKKLLLKATQAEVESKFQTLRKQRAIFANAVTDKDGTLRPSAIPIVTMMEYIMGPVMIYAPENELSDIWRSRIQSLQGLLDKAEARGEPVTLEHLIWSDILAYWHLRSKNYPQAKETLLAWNDRWDRMPLGSDDPWRTFRSIMSVCAQVGVAAEEAERTGACPLTTETLEKHERALLNASMMLSLAPPAQVFESMESHAALRPAASFLTDESTSSTRKQTIKIIVRDALLQLWGSRMLDRPGKAADLKHWLD